VGNNLMNDATVNNGRLLGNPKITGCTRNDKQELNVTANQYEQLIIVNTLTLSKGLQSPP